MTYASPLFIVRHGQTDWNIEGRFQGRTDIPLNAKGREQARACGNRLSMLLDGYGVDVGRIRMISSPLGRALETSRLIGASFAAVSEIIADMRFSEQGYGQWEGLTVAEIRERFPCQWRIRAEDPMACTPEGGESGEHLLDRVHSLLSECSPFTVLVGHYGSVLATIRLCKRQGVMLKGVRENPFASGLSVGQDRIFLLGDGVLSAVSVG